MKLKIIAYLCVFFFCGLAFGLWLGQKTSPDGCAGVGYSSPTYEEVDQFYSDVLKISDAQEAKLSEIERSYRDQRDFFTKQMHEANMRLAEVIEENGYENDAIKPLVGRIHSAMGDLQALSLTHLAAVEKVLTPGQAKLLKIKAVARLRQN